MNFEWFMCHLNPLGWTEHEGRETGFRFKVVKFDHFKMWVINPLPSSEEFEGGSGSDPVFDDIGGSG